MGTEPAPGRDPVTFEHCAHVRGPFFHGTRVRLDVGAHLLAGRESNFQRGRVMRHVYFTDVLETAVWGAELATALADPSTPAGAVDGLVYEVEPTGPFEDDPNVTDKKFPGNPTGSFRTRDPLRIVGVVEEWPAHAPEVLAGMLESLARLRAEGRDVIED